MRKMQRQATRDLLRGKVFAARRVNKEAAEAMAGLVNLGIATIEGDTVRLASAEKAKRFLAQ